MGKQIEVAVVPEHHPQLPHPRPLSRWRRRGEIALLLLAWALSAAPAFAQATQATREANNAFAATLPADGEDEDFSRRGFIGTRSDPAIKTSDGRIVWELSAYEWMETEAPPETVNVSLWRQARLLGRHGLFRVHERVYQVRGFDISNMTIVVGDTGLIVLDPLTNVETARAALALAREHLGNKRVVAMVYSHSHADHFGGARGVVEDSAGVRIIAPEHFLEHAVGENVIAGNAMGRRATYQFGAGLAPGPLGSLSSGIGPGVPSGAISLIPPTEYVTQTRQALTIDGVRFEFQLTPNTEAPSEMNAYLPDFRVLWVPENATATMHNILTPRGALVRDAKAWADHLTQTLAFYGPSADTLISSHAWPRFGGDRISDFLGSHRDAYKYLHDQTVRMMNQGLTGEEIAERIALPAALQSRWFNRGYYGTMRHNSRAIYQRYMGWYDGNPANLNPLPEEMAAPRYVAAMGGARSVIRDAQRAFDRGEYRWAGTILNHLVFAEPANAQAKELLARTHEQMAYQAESAIWRNMYLMAAAELRGGNRSPARTGGNLDLVAATPSAMILDLLSVRLNPQTASAMKLTLVFPERNERFAVEVRNSVLVYETDRAHPDAQATLTMPRAAFLAALFAPGTPSPPPRVEGDTSLFDRFRASFDAPDPAFAIVTP